MRLKVLLVSLLVLPLIGLFPSLANAQCGQGDEGVCDTVRIGCPFRIATVVPGDSIMVPIYVWNDEELGGFALGFKFDSTALEIVKKRYDFTGSVIPVVGIEEGIVKETYDPATLPGQYLFGWVEMTGETANRIPVNTTDKAKLVVTLNFKVKSTATPMTIMIDSAYYPPGGPFILSIAQVGTAVYPQYVHCPEGDIILGYPTFECCGDVDKTWDINIADVVYMLNYIFGHGAPPQDPRVGDVDCDLSVTIADVVYFINYIFVAGPKPCLGCEEPVITMFAAEPDTVEPGGVSRLTVSASDPNCQLLSYSYLSSGGSIAGYGDSATWTAPAIEGQYQVIATVANGNHQTSDSLFLFVVARTARIMGTLSLQPGSIGNLAGITVSVYASINNWAHNIALRSVVASGSGSSATYVIDGLPSGTYYLDAWQDNNDNDKIDDGDLFGWYGTGEYPVGSLTAINLVQYEWKTIDVNVSSYGSGSATK